jgi:hypothetical protein
MKKKSSTHKTYPRPPLPPPFYSPSLSHPVNPITIPDIGRPPWLGADSGLLYNPVPSGGCLLLCCSGVVSPVHRTWKRIERWKVLRRAVRRSEGESPRSGARRRCSGTVRRRRWGGREEEVRIDVLMRWRRGDEDSDGRSLWWIGEANSVRMKQNQSGCQSSNVVTE